VPYIKDTKSCWSMSDLLTTSQGGPIHCSATNKVFLAHTIWYDTVYLFALKSWRDGQPNLVHSTETKKEKTKNKNRVVQKKQSGQ